MVTRFVAFDCETTGTDPERDAIVTIGAVSIQNAEIVLEDAFDAMIKMDHATSSIVVHGITPAEAAEGVSPAEAVDAFLNYVGQSVLVGHHVGFDKRIVDRTAQKHLQRRLSNPALDTMRMTLALQEAGRLEAGEAGRFDLDGLCERFGIVPHDRHTASGDAFITAQIFLQLFRFIQKAGLRWQDLLEKEENP